MRKKMKARQSTAPKKYQEGGRVEDDSDIPAERGPAGRKYNQLLQTLRSEQRRERDAEDVTPPADFERRMRRLERQGFRPPTNEELAAEAARKLTERNRRISSAQTGQRIMERELEREGRRIGAAHRYSSGRLEDAGFKRGGKVMAKKAGGLIKGKK